MVIALLWNCVCLSRVCSLQQHFQLSILLTFPGLQLPLSGFSHCVVSVRMWKSRGVKTLRNISHYQKQKHNYLLLSKDVSIWINPTWIHSQRTKQRFVHHTLLLHSITFYSSVFLLTKLFSEQVPYNKLAQHPGASVCPCKQCSKPLVNRLRSVVWRYSCHSLPVSEQTAALIKRPV